MYDIQPLHSRERAVRGQFDDRLREVPWFCQSIAMGEQEWIELHLQHRSCQGA
jgi:hypothetical protein